MVGVKSPKAPEDYITEKNNALTMSRKATIHNFYSHQQFIIEYNGDRIVGASLNMTDLMPVEFDPNADYSKNKTLQSYYSVKWIENPEANFYSRFERYLDKGFFQHHIHWFSIFNSFMMVVFLTGLVAMIMMRALRKDYMRYNKDEDDLELLEREIHDESGWKLVHGDVFRPVEALIALSSLIGTGIQLVALAMVIIVFAIAGELWASRGALASVCIFGWAVTSFINGYISGGHYARNDGKDWVQCMIVTAGAFPLFIIVFSFFNNMYAVYWGSSAAVPFTSILLVFLIWGVMAFPLTVGGTIIGRNWSGVADLPCRVKRIPSPIPPTPFYFHPVVISLFGGILPFGSIFIELYFVMTSFWSYKVYYVYGFMLLTFVILLIVTSCISIVGTYFLLNSENYQWQWTSFCGGFSISIYTFAYACYYYFYKTKFAGYYQTAFYFNHSIMTCISLGIACGAISYLASSVFVKRIYRNVKCD